MRVALVTTSYPAFEGDPSGHFVEAEAKARAASDEVLVVTAAPRDEARYETPGVRVVRLDGGDAFGWPGVASRLRQRPLAALPLVRWMRLARAALRSLGRLDRIVAHWAVPCGWPIAASARAPLELVSHGADVRALLATPAPLRAAIVERLLRSADGWRFVSTSLRASLERGLGARQVRALDRVARVEACLIEVPDVRELADAIRAPHHGVRLSVCVGRLVPSKRVDRVIAHVARHPTGAGDRLVVVGDGPLRARLERHARALGVDALFVGQAPRPVALAWIAAADVVLHASRVEGLSTVAREAEALGTPFFTVEAEGTFP